tara:strand:+ start:5707 stop:6816 length:1110 start_codon:yes stop_codon:yes gene_type:complete
MKTNLKILNFKENKEKPKLITKSNGKWISYGENNQYPIYLLDTFHNKSNKHKAIISKKVDMTSGNGFEEVTTPQAKDFIANKWADMDLDEIVVRINYDYEIMNGFALMVKWSIDGKKIVELEWMPFHKCRLSSDEEFILVSKDWTNIRKSENKPIEYKRFDPKQTKEFKTQIFYYVELSNGIDYYPLPYYSSTLNWIELDYEISNFHLNGTRNGFSPSFMLNMATGVPSEEQMDEVHRGLQKKFAGTDNANNVLITYSEGKEQAPELTPINLNDSDERFILLHKEMLTEILIGHSVTSPMLFGIRTAGGLGGGSELLEALAIFQSTYVNGKQRVIEKQINKIASFAGVTETLILKDYTIDFTTIKEETK